MVKFSSALVAVAVVLGLTACGGGNDEGTTAAPSGEGIAGEGSRPNLPARLDNVSLRLRQRGFDVKATSAHPQTPRALWPTGGLRVETGSGPLTIYAYRSQRVVKELVNPRRDYGLAFPGYRTQWSAGPAGDELGGCGKYLYYGRNATRSRALRVADLCQDVRTSFIVQA